MTIVLNGDRLRLGELDRIPTHDRTDGEDTSRPIRRVRRRVVDDDLGGCPCPAAYRGEAVADPRELAMDTSPRRPSRRRCRHRRHRGARSQAGSRVNATRSPSVPRRTSARPIPHDGPACSNGSSTTRQSSIQTLSQPVPSADRDDAIRSPSGTVGARHPCQSSPRPEAWSSMAVERDVLHRAASHGMSGTFHAVPSRRCRRGDGGIEAEVSRPVVEPLGRAVAIEPAAPDLRLVDGVHGEGPVGRDRRRLDARLGSVRVSCLTAPPANACNHRSPAAAYTTPDPSGSQSKQPPPNPRPAAGAGSDVSIRSGPPSTATTTIAVESRDAVTNATREPSGDSFGSVSSRPATHISGVMAG